MSFNVSALNAYVDQSSKELFTSIVAGSNTFDNGFVSIVTGIKGGNTREVKFFDQVLEWQTGGCNLGSSGSTTFTVKNLSTTLFNAYQEWCSTDLMTKFPVLLRAGAANDMDMPEAIVTNIAEQAKRDIALAAWQGQYNTNGTGDIAAGISGWLKRLINTSYSGSTFKPSGSYTSFSSGTAIAIVDDLMANVPAEIANRPKELHLSNKHYNILKVALRDNQAISFNFETGSVDQFVMPGYDDLTIKKDDGLTGSKAMVMTTAGNLIFNTDLENDVENLLFGKNEQTKKDWFHLDIAVGTEITFPQYCGVYVSAA